MVCVFWLKYIVPAFDAVCEASVVQTRLTPDDAAAASRDHRSGAGVCKNVQLNRSLCQLCLQQWCKLLF